MTPRRPGFLAVAALALVVGVAALATGPARADEHPRHYPHHHRIHHPPPPPPIVMGYGAPTYVPEPPPIVYAPPAPPAVISFGINLNLR
jgi:hypothetical protein